MSRPDESRPNSGSAAVHERAVAAGLHTLSDAEALELLLSRSFCCEPAALAASLLQRFGSLPQVLTADLGALAAVAGQASALDLRSVYDAACRIAAAELRRREIISSWSALLAYLKLTMSHRTREAFRVLFLDKKNQLIADEVMGEGTIDHAPVYPREVMRRALELSASALILVHNHPSGDPTPSSADVDMTRRLVDAARVLDLKVHDHVVVGRGEVASFKALGLI